MKIRPLQDWAVIRPIEPEEKSAGGVFIPDVAREKPQEGEVLAIGGGRFKEKRDKKSKVTEKTFVKTTLRSGNRVLYEKYAVVRISVEGEEIVMVREEDVLGLLEP